MGRSNGGTPSNKGNNNDTRARSFSPRSKPRNMGRSNVGVPSNKGNNNDMTSSTGKKKSTKALTIDAGEVIATRTRGTSSSISPATRARSISPNNRTTLLKSLSPPIPRKAKSKGQQTPTTSAPTSGSKRQREASVEKVISKNEKAKAPSSPVEDHSTLNYGSGFSKKGRCEKELRPSPEGKSKSPLKGRELRALLGRHGVSSEGEKRASKELRALLGTPANSETEKKGSKKRRASLGTPAVMSSEAKEKGKKVRSSPRIEGRPEREERTEGTPGFTNKYELRALLGTPASLEAERKSSKKPRVSRGTTAVMSSEAKEKGKKLRFSPRMEGSPEREEKTEGTPGSANKYELRPLLRTPASSEAEGKGSKKPRVSLGTTAVMSSEAKEKGKKLRSSPRMEGSPEREEKTEGTPGSANRYELRPLLRTTASSEAEKKDSKKLRNSLGKTAVMSSEAKKKGKKLRSSPRMEVSPEREEKTEATPGSANKYSHSNFTKAQKRGRSGQFSRKPPTAEKPKEDPSSPSSSSSETGTNSEKDTAARRASTKDASKKTKERKAKFSAASEKPAVEESKESASKSVTLAERDTEEKKCDTKTDESAAVKETSPSKSSSRTEEGKNVKKKQRLSKEVLSAEPLSVKIPEETPIIQSLKELKHEEAVTEAETEKTESAKRLLAPEQKTDKKPEPQKDSKELTDIEAVPTVNAALSAPLTVEAPAADPPAGDSNCWTVSIVDGSTVTFRRGNDGSDPTEDVEMAEASELSTTDKKKSTAHKPVASSEIDSMDKISKRKRSNREESSENSSADGGKDLSENARQKDIPASKEERRRSLADEISNNEMEESVNDNDTGNRSENKQKRHDHRYDPAYAGIGANRIRIIPVIERRFLGSISNQVVERLLSEYALAANTEVWSPIEAPYSENEVVLEPKKTDDESSSGASETASKGSGHGSNETNDNEIPEVPGAPSVPKLVHKCSIPTKQAYRSGRPTVDPPILIDLQQPAVLAKSLQYLPTDYKVNILNRRTGEVLSGAKAVPLNELPALLQKDSALEPIIPPPGADPE
jgi:hypothetical protein